jgi:hypothetical protein
MTHDEILAMPAGREMDALIAEKVMGYVRMHYPDENSWGEHYFDDEYPSADCYKQVHFDNWSTDIAAAWEVVLHFMNDGWCPNLVNDDNGHWALSFVGVNNIPCTSQTSWIDDQRFWCDEAPLAICRAALLAVMDK